MSWYKKNYNKKSAKKHGWHPSWFASYLINFDDELNVADIVLIVSIIMNTLEPTIEMMDIGDINGDIDINVNDIVQLIYQIIYDE